MFVVSVESMWFLEMTSFISIYGNDVDLLRYHVILYLLLFINLFISKYEIKIRITPYVICAIINFMGYLSLIMMLWF